MAKEKRRRGEKIWIPPVGKSVTRVVCGCRLRRTERYGGVFTPCRAHAGPGTPVR
jgi:hypothetical protein